MFEIKIPVVLAFLFTSLLNLVCLASFSQPIFARSSNFSSRFTGQEPPRTHFKGQIANSKFEMILWRDGQTLRGNYYYVKIGSANSLNLKGKITEAGDFTMHEFDQSGNQTGNQTGEFKGVWQDDPNQSGIELVGEWRKPSGKEDIHFFASEQMINFSDSTKISAISINESFKAKRLEVSAQYPQIISPGVNTAGFNQAAKTIVVKETAGFKKEMLAQTAADLKFLPPDTDNYIDLNYNVQYFAGNDFISISFLENIFSGGAHPNYNYFTLNYDLKNGQELKLGDLFKPAAKYLQAISAFSLKSLQSRTSDGENLGLAQDIWEDGAKPTAENFKSWNLTRKGLMITFDPYQVGSYADGPQFVIVPYDELKSILKPDGAWTRVTR